MRTTTVEKGGTERVPKFNRPLPEQNQTEKNKECQHNERKSTADSRKRRTARISRQTRGTKARVWIAFREAFQPNRDPKLILYPFRGSPTFGEQGRVVLEKMLIDCVEIERFFERDLLILRSLNVLFVGFEVGIFEVGIL